MGGVAVFQGCPAIEVKGQVAHDTVKIAHRLCQRGEVVRALAEAQPGVLNHIFCLGPAAHDGGGIVDQGDTMRQGKLEPVIGVGLGYPGG